MYLVIATYQFSNIETRPQCLKRVNDFTNDTFIVELRRPEGPPSGAPYNIEEKETHGWTFS